MSVTVCARGRENWSNKDLYRSYLSGGVKFGVVSLKVSSQIEGHMSRMKVWRVVVVVVVFL